MTQEALLSHSPWGIRRAVEAHASQLPVFMARKLEAQKIRLKLDLHDCKRVLPTTIHRHEVHLNISMERTAKVIQHLARP